jgi:hypothetical protein
MALKSEVNGQIVISDQDNNTVVFSKQLNQMFKSVTGLDSFSGLTKRKILDGDNSGNPVALDTNGVSPIKGFVIWIESGNGTLEFAHGGNSVPLQIDSALIVFGSFTLPTVKSVGAVTNPLTFWYGFF